MKSKLIKITAAAGLLATSAGTSAATNDCRGSIEWCLEMLACCL